MSRPARLVRKLSVLLGIVALAALPWRPQGHFSNARRSLANIAPTSRCNLETLASELRTYEFDRQAHLALIQEDLDPARLSQTEPLEPSYLIAAVDSTPEGATAELVLRPGRTWFSLYGRSLENPQGDARAVARALGPRAARAFGFTLSRAWRRLRVPFADRLNHTLSQLSERGIATGLRFFDAEGKVTSRVAIRRYAVDGAFAIARIPQLLSHDLSFHALAILIPPPVIQHSRAQVMVSLRFLEALDRLLPRLSMQERAIVRQLIERFEYRVINRIDTGTGNFGNSFRRPFHELATSEKNSLVENGYRYLTYGGVSPRRFTEAILAELLRDAKIEPDTPIYDQIFSAFQDSLRRDPSPHLLDRQLTASREFFLGAVESRYQAIRDQAEELSSPHDPDSF
jgi:hypothetical protein